MNPNPDPVKLNKADRVECVHKGVTLYGAIFKVASDKATMMLDGGKQSLTGPLSSFQPSTHPLPVDPIQSSANHWTVVDFDPFNGRDDCVAFEAILCRDGKPVLRAYNNGIAGCDEISPINEGTRLDVSEYRSAAKAWASANGEAKISDPGHLWLVWYIEKRPFGITSADFLKTMKARQTTSRG